MTKATKMPKFLLKDVKNWIKTLVNNNNYNWYFFIDCNEHRLTVKVILSNYRLKWINIFVQWPKTIAKTDIYPTNLKNLPKTIKTINSFI
jgi:hypothetical protein